MKFFARACRIASRARSPHLDPMTFTEWQELKPDLAARQVHGRVRERLPPAQQRAVIAMLSSELKLAERFRAAAHDTPLGGVPFLAKDIFDAADAPTFAGSTFLPEVRPPRAVDGAFVQVVRSAGGVFAGKTHLHEFAYGVTGENPHYGDCEHPQFPGRTTGGSSSGSAAAVAAGVVPFALGSDTGGSIRVPAAFCGLFGFRLAPGNTWIRDAMPLAPSYDSAGWFTANAVDMRSAISALVGRRPVQQEPRGCYLEMPGVDPDVAAACRVAAERLTDAADSAVAAELTQAFAPALSIYHTTVAREAWDAHRGWAQHYREQYDPAVWQRLIRAHDLTATQIEAARSGTAALRATWLKFFHRFDFLVMPATPCPALTKAECTLENRNRILTLNAPASIGGLPVLTIPVALPSGMSAGLQVIVNQAQSPVIGWALNRFA